MNSMVGDYIDKFRWFTWTIYLYTVRMQMHMGHTFSKCLHDFANTNSRQNVANVSLIDLMLSILDMWLVLVNYVLTLIKFRL